MSYRFSLVVFLDSFKYSRRPRAMVQYGIITYIRCLDTADYYHQCARRNAGCTSTIIRDLKSSVNWLTNKAVSPLQMDSPTNAKNCSTTYAQSKSLKIKYQMFLIVPLDILILGKIARCVFCIIKSNYIVSYNSF